MIRSRTIAGETLPVLEVEFLCPAGYDMVWIPLVTKQKDEWCLVLTDKWKIEDGKKMYIEATRYWPKTFIDRLFGTTPNKTDWYAEDKVRFIEINGEKHGKKS